MKSVLKFFSFLFTLTLLISCGGGGGEEPGGGGGGGGGGARGRGSQVISWGGYYYDCHYSQRRPRLSRG